MLAPGLHSLSKHVRERGHNSDTEARALVELTFILGREVTFELRPEVKNKNKQTNVDIQGNKRVIPAEGTAGAKAPRWNQAWYV